MLSVGSYSVLDEDSLFVLCVTSDEVSSIDIYLSPASRSGVTINAVVVTKSYLETASWTITTRTGM